MRTGLAVGITVAALLGAGRASAQADVHTLLDSIRSTLGGAALGDVQSFRAEGRCVRTLGPLTLGSRITLTLVRPDRYLRNDSLSLPGRTARMATGFAGDRVIQWAATEDGRRMDPADLMPSGLTSQTIPDAVPELRHELRLLLLGWFGDAFDGLKPRASYEGVAEAPDATADAIRLTFPDGSSATLFTDRSTRLPLMVSWQAPDTLAPLRALSARGSPTLAPSLTGGGPAGRVPASSTPDALPLVEHRLYFSDYRPVGKVRWPFVIRRGVGGQLTEEMRFDRIAVNPAVDPQLFTVGR